LVTVEKLQKNPLTTGSGQAIEMDTHPKFITEDFLLEIIRRFEQDDKLVSCMDGWRISRELYQQLSKNYHHTLNEIRDFYIDLNYDKDFNLHRNNNTNNNNMNNNTRFAAQIVLQDLKKGDKKDKEKIVKIKAGLKPEFNSGNYAVDIIKAFAYNLMGDKWRKGRKKIPSWLSLEELENTLIDGGYVFV